MKENLNKWQDNPCLWARSLNIVKMETFPKLLWLHCKSLSQFQQGFKKKLIN